MYNILVLENDCIQLRTLSEIIRQAGDMFNVYEASSISEAFEIAEQVRIDLFYIDINLNEDSGLNFALEMRKKDRYKLTWIVFVTIYKDYMLSAFKKIHCYDYILKPYNKQYIQKLTRLLLSEGKAQVAVTAAREKYIIVDVKNIQVKIYVSEIIFVEVFIRTSIIHTINGAFTINYLSLKKLYSMINDENIIQSHRSFLVNTKYISKIEKTTDKTSYKIYFYNTSETALLGYNYKKAILDKFSNGQGGEIIERL
ncbi:LytTR family DNA-binding domain-containing protein [Clostridium swellfunianum]|uniref:LytR/AlgR family response regulator transcription factor n=1 Tax=Clostridium swellfunianum TaxID=1367462 RepID=UPI00202EE941|nr:LytTR family DNA-binding domain-containing protein [Clostridium swellfunianum]MCM0647522.1 LytTR family DNA-binding domain-containing protein [Clostridium swellfunianum]